MAGFPRGDRANGARISLAVAFGQAGPRCDAKGAVAGGDSVAGSEARAQIGAIPLVPNRLNQSGNARPIGDGFPLSRLAADSLDRLEGPAGKLGGCVRSADGECS